MKKAFITSILALALLSAVSVYAAEVDSSSCSGIKSFGQLVNCAIGFINNAVYLIMGASVLYTVWGAFTMIRSEEKREEGKQIILYGIIGLFVMVSIWGLVNILNSTFKLDTAPVEPTPFNKL